MTRRTPTIDEAPMLTADDVAEALSCSRSHAYALMRQMPHEVYGRSVRVSPEDFQAWREQRRVAPAVPIPLPHPVHWVAPPRAATVQRGARIRVTYPRTKPKAEPDVEPVPYTQPRTARRLA